MDKQQKDKQQNAIDKGSSKDTNKGAEATAAASPAAKKGLDVSAKSFITAIAILAGLMVITYILTFIIPGGHYGRVVNDAGQTVIDTASGFTSVDGGIEFWRWLLSPILVLGEGSTAIAIIIYLMVIGGVFNSLEKRGIMKYMLQLIIERFGEKREVLLAVITLFFMLWGSLVGSFEECVLLVPIVCILSVSLGWDILLGMGMSLLADGCGFAAGICNPFSVGVAQTLADLPLFSGVWLRIVAFVLIYILLVTFLRWYARRIQKPFDPAAASSDFARDAKMDRATKYFVIIFLCGLAVVFSSSVITFLQDYTMIIMGLVFLAAGVTSVLVSGASGKELASTFGAGAGSLWPAILMILMARSIEYTLSEANVLDTIIHAAVQTCGNLPLWSIILFIYLVVLVMNFFISSASAKAFLLIPLIVPTAQLFGISPQLCILAFAFGDGFSNVIYPTNPVLLICLGIENTSYGKWFRFSWKFQLSILVLTCGLLLFGLAIGY